MVDAERTDRHVRGASRLEGGGTAGASRGRFGWYVDDGEVGGVAAVEGTSGTNCL